MEWVHFLVAHAHMIPVVCITVYVYRYLGTLAAKPIGFEPRCYYYNK